MKVHRWILGISLVVLVVPAFGQGHTEEGAVLGGVAGAIAGGIIGHQNDETPEGAILGGILGAVTGSMIGDRKDQQAARQQRLFYHQQRVAARAVSTAEVVTMTRSGLTDSVIINHIRANGVPRQLNTHDIISLHQQGVSEKVITAMQNAGVGQVHVVESPPVIIHRQYRAIPEYGPRRHLHVYRYSPRRWRSW